MVSIKAGDGYMYFILLFLVHSKAIFLNSTFKIKVSFKCNYSLFYYHFMLYDIPFHLPAGLEGSIIMASLNSKLLFNSPAA